jgi:hypothetical protein
MAGGTFVTGSRGVYKSKNTSTRAAGGPDGSGILENVIAGNNYIANQGGSGKGAPFQLIPESESGQINSWIYSNNPRGLASQGAITTDGLTEWFQTLTNSATCQLTSTQAGYEGLPKITLGTVQNGQATFIATPGYTPGYATGTLRLAMLYTRIYFPSPATANGAYNFFFGWATKSIDPLNAASGGTGPTDYAAFQGLYSSSTCLVTACSGNNASTTYSQTATASVNVSSTLNTISAAGSLELAITMTGPSTAATGSVSNVTYWYRVPGTASNTWSTYSYTTAAKLPRYNQLLRPHLEIVPVAASPVATNYQVQTPIYVIERPTTF